MMTDGTPLPQLDLSRVVPTAWPAMKGRTGVNVGFAVPAGGTLPVGVTCALAAGLQFIPDACMDSDGTLCERERRAVVHKFLRDDRFARYEPVFVRTGFEYRRICAPTAGECSVIVVDYDCGNLVKKFAVLLWEYMTSLATQNARVVEAEITPPLSNHMPVLREMLPLAEMLRRKWASPTFLHAVWEIPTQNGVLLALANGKGRASDGI